MLNHPASPSVTWRSNRLRRTGFYFLFSLGCAIFGPLLLGPATLAQSAETLHLNGGVLEWVGAAPAEKSTLTPLVICCILFLIGIVIFLLQPLYLKQNSRSRSTSRSKFDAKQASRSTVTSSNHDVSPDSSDSLELVLPMFDRLVITPLSIMASTCRSAHSAPEIRSVPRTLPQLTQLLEDSLAEVIVLTGREMTLDASEVVLGIQRLHRNNLDVVTLQSGSFGDRTEDPESLRSALYDFLCHTLENSQIDGSGTSYGMGHRTGYIVSRKALIAMLRLSQGSVADRLGAMVPS